MNNSNNNNSNSSSSSSDDDVGGPATTPRRTVPYGGVVVGRSSLPEDDTNSMLMRMPGQPQSDSDDNNDNNDDDNNDDDDASRNEYTVIIDDDIMIHSMMHTSGSRRNRPLVTGEDPTKSISTMAITCTDHLHDWLDRHVDENLRFTIRVTVALALSSLVVLCQPPYPDEVLPSPFWVYITAGVTSFQASPDSGAVMKKAWQRCLGTIIGGVFGLAFGAITILIPLSTTLNNPYVWQALYIGTCTIIIVFFFRLLFYKRITRT